MSDRLDACASSSLVDYFCSFFNFTAENHRCCVVRCLRCKYCVFQSLFESNRLRVAEKKKPQSVVVCVCVQVFEVGLLIKPKSISTRFGQITFSGLWVGHLFPKQGASCCSIEMVYDYDFSIIYDLSNGLGETVGPWMYAFVCLRVCVCMYLWIVIDSIVVAAFWMGWTLFEVVAGNPFKPVKFTFCRYAKYFLWVHINTLWNEWNMCGFWVEPNSFQ